MQEVVRSLFDRENARAVAHFAGFFNPAPRFTKGVCQTERKGVLLALLISCVPESADNGAATSSLIG